MRAWKKSTLVCVFVYFGQGLQSLGVILLERWLLDGTEAFSRKALPCSCYSRYFFPFFSSPFSSLLLIFVSKTQITWKAFVQRAAHVRAGYDGVFLVSLLLLTAYGISPIPLPLVVFNIRWHREKCDKLWSGIISWGIIILQGICWRWDHASQNGSYVFFVQNSEILKWSCYLCS